MNRKYRTLGQVDSESEESQVNEQSSMYYTLRWANKVQKMSKDLTKMSFKDNVSISLSDKEREIVNNHSAQELKENLLSAEVKTTKSPRDLGGVIKRSVLTSKEFVPKYLQTSQNPYTGQSKLKIVPEVVNDADRLQFGDFGNCVRGFPKSLDMKFSRNDRSTSFERNQEHQPIERRLSLSYIQFVNHVIIAGLQRIFWVPLLLQLHVRQINLVGMISNHR